MDLLATSGGRLAILVALLVVASLAFLAARRRDGVFRVAAPRRGTTTATLSTADLGGPLGSRATFVQFSTPTCASCPQVSRVLGALAGELPGIAHVELDATRHPELVRRLGVLRTPTVLLLGPEGELRSRTSGALDRATATSALELAVAGA